MKTISERIDAVVADLFFEEQITALVVATTLKKHFADPWLDKPDGPGRWWRKSDTSTSLMKLRGQDFEHWEGLQCKWQRVIGPSD